MGYSTQGCVLPGGPVRVSLRAVASPPQRIIDVQHEPVGCGYRIGEEHRTEKGWYFTGKYDHDGNPYFMRHPSWFRRLYFWRRLPIWIAYALLIVVAVFVVVALVTATISGHRPP